MIKLLKRTIFSFLFCFSIWFGGFVWFVMKIPTHPILTTPPSDAIVVLTGGSGRLEEGLELLAKRKAKMLFVSGVSKKTTLDDLLHYIEPATRKKVETMPIVLGHEAENTVGNARETIAWLRKEKHKDIYLVTSNYHMPRSLIEMREAAPELNFIPAPVFPEDVSQSPWWQNKPVRTLVLIEYHKFLASKLRHWFVSYFRPNAQS